MPSTLQAAAATGPERIPTIVAGEHQDIDACRIEFPDEAGTAVGVHLEVEIRHDLELHDSMTCRARIR